MTRDVVSSRRDTGKSTRALLLIREPAKHRDAGLKNQLRICEQAAAFLETEIVAEIMLANETQLIPGLPSEHGGPLPWLGPVDFVLVPSSDLLMDDSMAARLWIDSWNRSTRTPQIVLSDQFIEDVQDETLTYFEKEWLGIPHRIITAQELETKVAQFARENPLLDITFRIIEAPEDNALDVGDNVA